MKLKERFTTERLKERAEKRRIGGRANRFAAFGIDHFIQLFAVNILILVMWLIMLGFGKVVSGGDINLYTLPTFMQIPTIILMIAVPFFYQVILPCYFIEGQSFGKRLIGLKIVQTNDEKATLKNYILRFIGMMLEGHPNFSITGTVVYFLYAQYLTPETSKTIGMILGYIFAASIIIALFQRNRRSIHDFIGNTKVIPVTPKDLTDYSRAKDIKVDVSNM